MSKVSFEGIGEVAATFACAEGVKAGQAVKLTASGSVGPCAAGDRPCGVALSVRDGFAAVQVAGFAAVPVTGTVPVGWTALTADGQGGMKTPAAAAAESETAAETGTVYLVARAEGGCAVVLL